MKLEGLCGKPARKMRLIAGWHSGWRVDSCPRRTDVELELSFSPLSGQHHLSSKHHLGPNMIRRAPTAISASPADVAEVEAYLTAAKEALHAKTAGSPNTTADTTGVSIEEGPQPVDAREQEKRRKEGMTWSQRMGA